MGVMLTALVGSEQEQQQQQQQQQQQEEQVRVGEQRRERGGSRNAPQCFLRAWPIA